MSQEQETVVHSPFCERIRSKKYFFLETIPMTEEDIGCVCWCAQTNQAVGPDGHVVLTEDCRPGRDCYVSAI